MGGATDAMLVIAALGSTVALVGAYLVVSKKRT
jgi:hypothetical protein